MLRVSEKLDRSATGDEFAACVAEAELHALKELKAFCREAERSTYVI